MEEKTRERLLVRSQLDQCAAEYQRLLYEQPYDPAKAQAFWEKLDRLAKRLKNLGG